jgi:uncharacterized protein
VVSPLAEAGIGKDEVRHASRALGLATWDKPQQACLSSRIPRGVPITLVALRRVERAERLLHAEGFRQVRVREHGECARIEVEPADIARLLDEPLRTRIVAGLRACGYAFVALDLEGFESGRMNRLNADVAGSPIPPAASVPAAKGAGTKPVAGADPAGS